VLFLIIYHASTHSKLNFREEKPYSPPDNFGHSSKKHGSGEEEETRKGFLLSSRWNYQQQNINFASDILPEGITSTWDYPWFKFWFVNR
jgi:hypothetical protein